LEVSSATRPSIGLANQQQEQSQCNPCFHDIKPNIRK
jgi:hypothetical protein